MKNKLALKNATIYQIYVRNHTVEGTFLALINDLPRIKDLGVSILYLLPIHPIGQLARKGTLGSPYSIKDYYAIDEALGSKDDFKLFLKTAHEMGFKVMMDVVLNHTSRDAVLIEEHPEFYFYKDQTLINRIGDWSDVADLNYALPEVRDYMVKMLTYWVKFGVDGFRCDVAPLLPMEFWHEVILKTSLINDHLIWLAESVEPEFIKYLREKGYDGHSDSELYQVFDILYDYDIYPSLKTYLKKDGDLKAYLRLVKTQEYIYPVDYLKIHFLENHDQDRIASIVKDETILRNLTAWSFFQNGVGFLYAGQEVQAKNRPSLFEKDPLDLTIKNQAFYKLIKRLIEVKKDPMFSEVLRFDIINHLQLDLIAAKMTVKEGELFGLFNTSKYERMVYVPLDDGTYKDFLSGKRVVVKNGILTLKDPLFLKLI